MFFFFFLLLQMNWYSFLLCVSQTIFDLSPKLHLSFIGTLHRELSLPLVQAEVFLCFLTVWESKSHSIYWTDHQGCPLWHVMTHTASFLLFVSVAEGNWWCCQDMLYTIKHRAERQLSASPLHEPPLSRLAILHPVLFVWPYRERKVTLILSLGLAAVSFEEPKMHFGWDFTCCLRRAIVSAWLSDAYWLALRNLVTLDVIKLVSSWLSGQFPAIIIYNNDHNEVWCEKVWLLWELESSTGVGVLISTSNLISEAQLPASSRMHQNNLASDLIPHLHLVPHQAWAGFYHQWWGHLSALPNKTIAVWVLYVMLWERSIRCACISKYTFREWRNGGSLGAWVGWRDKRLSYIMWRAWSRGLTVLF